MLTLCVAGDIILMAPIPEEYAAESESLRKFIHSANLRASNMESTISDYDQFASTYCGGSWLTVPSYILKELDMFGFQYYSFANNHTMDYSYGGLLSTMKALEDHGVQYSGVGRSLAEATAPAVLEHEGKKVGIISVTTTCDDAARAGDASHMIPARPGVNMLRHSETFAVNEAHMKALQEIAEATYINGRINNSKRGGYTVDIPGVFQMGPLFFTESPEEGKRSAPHAGDTKRITDAIREARKSMDYVIMYLHSHEIKGDTDDEPDYFLETFAHQCIDAGAAAVVCSGTHQIKAAEVYNGAPILYSIANFIFQSDLVSEVPKDFYDKYKVPFHYTAAEAIGVRSAGGTRGLQTDVNNYMGLVPIFHMEDGKVTKVVMQPTELCFRMGKEMKGLPRVADSETAEWIYNRIKQLSSPYGTELTMDDGKIILTL